MIAGDILLGLPGQEVKLPTLGRTGVEEQDIEISKSQRTASGRLVSDVIAVKKKFVVNYDTLRGTDLKTVLGLYQPGRPLNLILYDQDGTQRSYTVRMSPITRQREIVAADEWFWGGVKVELEEV